MPENPRPPATFRITRPWGSEKEFIEGDLAYLGRTAIILPNAPPCDVGALVRFEIVLATGAPAFRGEGHVVAHHPPGGAKPAGLEVRFTRIDARSKLVVDRVRERRTTLSRGSPSSANMVAPLLESVSPPGPPQEIRTSYSPPERSMSVTMMSAVVDPGLRPGKARSPVAAPPNRDEILERLRARARGVAAAGGLPVKKK